MTDRNALVGVLRKQLTEVAADLRAISDDTSNPWAQQLRAEYDKARAAGRTAQTWSEWREGEVSLAAVAWVLGVVFVRFCEDNELLDRPWISGSGVRLAEAADAETQFYREDPSRNARDWLRDAFRQLAAYPATQGLVDPAHSAVWRAPLSADACGDILQFWRTQEADGLLTWSLEDPRWDTRFLGDLYQDLSEFAKKKYALLQTPDFVEEFILDRTLTPALGEVPLAELKLVDPTCGSGHFLLGAFQRILDKWLVEAPAMDTRERVQKALTSVNGVDLNPFAVAIARFRLTLAALKACGVTRLGNAPALKLRVAVADSLLAGRPRQLEIDFVEDPDSVLAAHRYVAEDVDEYPGILERGTYHVVVGNPPYITVKDAALNEAYRRVYSMCHREYALTVPFLELLFELAVRESEGTPAGYVGQITANSFMKREFGVKVVEELLSGRALDNPVDLREIIDTSGAFLPGHGTPTMILLGRRRGPLEGTVRAVLGRRSEPGRPNDPSEGLVWREIVQHVDEPGFVGNFVAVEDIDRRLLMHSPWLLSAGGYELAGRMGWRPGFPTLNPLGERTESIGYSGQTNADPAFLAPRRSFERRRVEPSWFRQFTVGEVVRDFVINDSPYSLFPYDRDGLRAIQSARGALKWLWPSKAVTWARATFSKRDYRSEGRTWWEWHQIALRRLRVELSLVYSNVATHNHFVLDREQRLYNPHAPAIQLPDGTTENDHLELLGVLNSSVACFWLKQVSQNKGRPGAESAGADEAWEHRYEFTATKLQEFPLPPALSALYGRRLDDLARALEEVLPAQVLERGLPSRSALDSARRQYDELRALLVYWQEELDWHVYRAYGLIPFEMTYSGDPIGLGPAERAFAIAMARDIESGILSTTWFEHHNHSFVPVTNIPQQWPAAYRDLVNMRLELLAADRSIDLLERPEYKRRWEARSWESLEQLALTAYVLDRLERPQLWTSSGGLQSMTVAQIADGVRHDEEVQAGLNLLYGADADRVKAIGALLGGESVPFLAAYRYKPSGMTKRAEWEEVWDLQRREDAGEKVDIPVPPKYTSADFRKTSYWKARGKLDVPKERFIAYPGAERANDATAVFGWAGWDHGEQAQALAAMLVDRQDREGWDAERVTPLLAGLVELEPWLRQWHNDIDPEYGTSLAQDITALLDQRLATVGLTRGDVRGWQPPEKSRGRRSAS